MLEVPEGSIYYWMYIQGLKHVPLREVISAVQSVGKSIRFKDEQNYWNGWYNSDLYKGSARASILDLNTYEDTKPSCSKVGLDSVYSEYPKHPYIACPEPANRYVPCSKDGKPLIKWSNGCMLRSEALATRGCSSLAENLKGCQHIVVDFDGDHSSDLDIELITFAASFSKDNHMLSKPVNDEVTGYPVSCHVTFKVDRVIPTMHFNKAHIDIIGNQRNSIRYFKNKVWNGIEEQWMTDDTWKRIMDYIKRKEEE